MHIKFLQRSVSQLSKLVCGISVFAKDVDVAALGRAIFYANHSSHFDFIAIWSSLPENIRLSTRPVAALDYWGKPGIRRFFGHRIFNSILIERNRGGSNDDPLREVKEALVAGDSIIIFPEGTRSIDGTIQPFKSGIFHLAKEFPDVPLVPVCLDNLNRILPKGEFLIVPLLSRVTFGGPIYLSGNEEKGAFLARSKLALEALA